MAFYSFEMVLVGIILLSAMGIGGVRLWLKRKNEATKLQNVTESEPNDSNLVQILITILSDKEWR